MGAKRITNIEKEYIYKLYENGVNKYEIAKKTGRSYSSICNLTAERSTETQNDVRVANKDGLQMTNATEQTWIAITKMVDAEGITKAQNAEIGKIAGVSKATVAHALGVLFEYGIVKKDYFVDDRFQTIRTIKLLKKADFKEIKDIKKEEKPEKVVETTPGKTTALLNDILQELKHLSKRMDEIAQIGYDQRDREIVYAKAQLDKLSSISAALHKED